jgi:hypothetical protein
MADILITPASSLMAFTSSLNYKQTLTQEASGSLTLLGSGSTGRTDVFTVNGNNGTLFSISDDLSNSLFSVNTIAGLPVIEAFANNTVVMGQYGQNVLVVTGSRVGIGTATPSTTLHISAGDSSRVLFGPNATWGAYLYVGASPNITSNTVAQVISTNGNLHLDSGTSQNTYINGYSQTNTFINPEGGSVSIGTYDNPGARLQVNTSSDVVAIFKRTANGASGIQFTNAGSNNSTLYGGYDSYALRYFYNTSEYLTMDTSGNVGIGITSPATKLDVNGGIKATTIQLTSGAASGYVLTSDSTGNGSWQAASGGGGGIHVLIPPRSGQGYGLATNVNFGNQIHSPGGDLLTWFPFIPANTLTIDRITLYVNNAVTSGVAVFTIYSNLNGMPDRKLFASSNIDCSTTGYKTITTTRTFTAGEIYWFGLTMNDTNIQFYAMPTAASYSFAWANGTGTIFNVNSCAYLYTTSPGSEPNTVDQTAVNFTFQNLLNIILRST